MHPLGLTLLFSGRSDPPPHHLPKNENFPPYTLTPPLLPFYLTKSTLSLLYVSITLSIFLHLQIITSPDLLISWIPVTLYYLSILSLYLRSVLLFSLRSCPLALILYASFLSISIQSS